ncbi:MAG TPA: hypothetical protein VG347_06815, partial [Verrucomicrobiae bacterium]|nr:hypothetical protein [Verrucomicrobiae bacterium]
QEEPLKTECQHFIDCIKYGATPVSCGTRGTELVSILEASSESLRKGGAPVQMVRPQKTPQPTQKTSKAIEVGINIFEQPLPAPRLQV